MILTFFESCSPSIPAENPKQSVYLFKDKDGLYEYDFQTAKEKLIYKCQDFQIFLDEPYTLKNDTLTFGIVGQQGTSSESKGLYYHDYYVSVDLKTGKSRVSREVKYEALEWEKTLNIKVCDIDLEFRQKVVSDTTMPYLGYTYSYRGLKFNKPNFYSEHRIGHQIAYSLDGSLNYMTDVDGVQSDILLPNPSFDPRFGGGNLQPQLDPTGSYVLYTFVPVFQKEPASLRKIGLKDKKVEIVKEGIFAHPVISADGKFVLFGRDSEENKLEAWESDIYILDLTTKQETKIAKAGLAQWKK
ncbi:hypothetical protein [Flavobacterium sp.]|uniref:hypothetical protein n=1 Tax=Flavobacterium sp. TaxID=239 RepID=UPI0039E35639